MARMELDPEIEQRIRTDPEYALKFVKGEVSGPWDYHPSVEDRTVRWMLIAFMGWLMVFLVILMLRWL